MLYLLANAALSGPIVAIASEVARRWPGRGALTMLLYSTNAGSDRDSA